MESEAWWGTSSWGPKRVRDDLATKQQQKIICFLVKKEINFY